MNEIIGEAVVSYARGVKAVVSHELGTHVEAIALAGWRHARLAGWRGVGERQASSFFFLILSRLELRDAKSL